MFIKDVSARAQVENIKRTTGGDFGNFPIVLDIEPRIGETFPAAGLLAVTRNIAAMIEECERVFLHTPIVYTSAGAWDLFVGKKLLSPLAEILPRVALFAADYTGPVAIPLGWTRWDFHQRGKKPRA